MGKVYEDRIALKEMIKSTLQVNCLTGEVLFKSFR